MESIDELKSNISGEPKYKLRNGDLFVSPGGIHFLDYLDPVGEISTEIDAAKLTDEESCYIEKALQSNDERFENQVNIVKSHLQQSISKVIDIGCGGGLFLSKFKNLGSEVVGVELNDSRAQYAKTIHGLEIHKRPIESSFWPENYSEYFDAVTIWDVIEHVNYPLATLRSATKVLKKNGLIFIDTPCRDSFYHRFGELSYKISNGAFPTFLNTMYSSHLFGHKQIFSTIEMKSLLESAGLEVVLVKKFHELSFPHSYYLKMMLKSDLLVKLALPLVKIFLFVFPVKNKMLAIARKK
ncbi:MAG: class I SAM-dependent methyltransferase [Candidatus Marinimicrobia bacterium]|jgi:2-polyprenyl-6-hydroxyphenyl methylase/3-demethylubiquinone-9 3-methyltransferase|nr:class I SAM-dependent methyltransferase [Candidatus Neomarinimicrobiota bacterium]MBT3682115.1 class I SAM-dependent methyltransferase [Candidatus Neomarinimicrobiota bacterium]MBT3895245.1 class I SAM-dependent methyltransferase [Candidatus Neomarinimicrobiota bacterium]MBT4536973.1 class I SAM-dependent methyltransferase [Candidatus Neomarinimicrobiota bacterium]MBT5210542.1 class I SAM-dependent methyltransferase [Candidatus Neomarinimicrobiota bacterium]